MIFWNIASESAIRIFGAPVTLISPGRCPASDPSSLRHCGDAREPRCQHDQNMLGIFKGNAGCHMAKLPHGPGPHVGSSDRLHPDPRELQGPRGDGKSRCRSQRRPFAQAGAHRSGYQVSAAGRVGLARRGMVRYRNVIADAVTDEISALRAMGDEDVLRAAFGEYPCRAPGRLVISYVDPRQQLGLVLVRLDQIDRLAEEYVEFRVMTQATRVEYHPDSERRREAYRVGGGLQRNLKRQDEESAVARGRLQQVTCTVNIGRREIGEYRVRNTRDATARHVNGDKRDAGKEAAFRVIGDEHAVGIDASRLQRLDGRPPQSEWIA